jgi:preprotein translocase subunit YajC
LSPGKIIGAIGPANVIVFRVSMVTFRIVKPNKKKRKEERKINNTFGSLV